MAEIIIDGFDTYGPAGITNSTLAQALLQQFWLSAPSNAQIVSSLSSVGAAVYIGSTGQLTDTLPGSYSCLVGGIRLSLGGLSTQGVAFLNTGTYLCTITVNAAGQFQLHTGGYNGTVLGTSTASIGTNATHYLEWDITFGASAAYNLYLDGVSILSGTGNTGSSNANQFSFGCFSGSNATFDDLYLFDTTGTVNNAVLLDNPRIETTFPASDSQAQFTVGASTLGQSQVLLATSTSNSPGANRLFLRKFTPSVNCTLASISLVPQSTNATANYRPVAYADSSGAPGTLLSAGSTVTGTTAGTALTGALTTPQSLTAGTPVWLGFQGDTAINLYETDGNLSGYSAASTFSPGAPSTAPAMTAGLASWVIWGNLSAATGNWYEEDQFPVPGDLSYVSSSTVGQQDYYNFNSLSMTPTTIHTVALMAPLRRTDTGTRTASLTTKSSTSTSVGSNSGVSPGTSYQWMQTFVNKDPATGSAWTAAGLNAAVGDPTVAS